VAASVSTADAGAANAPLVEDNADDNADSGAGGGRSTPGATPRPKEFGVDDDDDDGRVLRIDSIVL